MKLQLLPLEESAKLKNLGFDWPCHYFHNERGCFHVSSKEGQAFSEGIHPEWGLNFNHRYSTDKNEFPVSAPTLDLACKWLRDTHDVSVEPGFRGHLKNKKVWACIACRASGLNFIGEMKEGGTWEEAQLHGIREAIEWLSGNLHRCLKCGGQGKPSKALLDEMARLCTEDALELGGHVEVPSGAAKMVNCTKCASCGHSWIEDSRKNHNKNA